MNLQFRRWPRSLFALRLCKITDSYVTFNDRIDRSINYFSVKKVAIASTNTDTREQALDYTSVRRRIASSIRRSSARVSINTYRREEEVEKRHGSRRSFRFSKLTELVPSNEHIFIYRVPCIGEIFRETEHEMSLTWKHHASSPGFISLLPLHLRSPLTDHCPQQRSSVGNARGHILASLLLERYFEHPRYADSFNNTDNAQRYIPVGRGRG